MTATATTVAEARVVSRRVVGAGARWLLSALAALVAVGCANPRDPNPHPPNEIRFPFALAIDPSSRYLYVSNTNVDVRYDGGALSVVDLVTNQFVADAAVQTPNFGGILTLHTLENGQVMGYMPDREFPALNWFRIDYDASGVPNINCGGVDDADSIETCTSAFRIQSLEENDIRYTVGRDPFGCGVRPRTGEDDLLFTGSLSDGTLAVFDLNDTATTDRGVGEPRFVDSRRLADPGLYGIASSPQNGKTYVASQFAQRLYQVTTEPSLSVVEPYEFPDDAPRDPPSGTLSFLDQAPTGSPVKAIELYALPNLASGTSLGQSIVLSDDGNRAFVTFRSPPSVAVVDLTQVAVNAGPPDVIKFVSVGSQPTEMALVDSQDGTRTSLYVTCFGSNEIFVIDTDSLEVTDVIETDRGPADIVVATNPELGFRRAYVALFSDDAIAVIDLDEDSALFHRVVATIR